MLQYLKVVFKMDLTYEISSLFLLSGYALYILGICSHAWKFETGYDYGLWYRCDRRGCDFYSVDFLDYLNVVRIGIVFSTLFFAVSCICLLIEVVMVMAHSNSKHKRRIGKTVIATSMLSEMATSALLAFYGCKTLLKNEKLPALMWGFAATGCGLMICVLGTILRLMGPVSTWNQIPCMIKANKNTKLTKAQERREIYRRREKFTQQSRQRPTRVNPYQPRDVVVYKNASLKSHSLSRRGLGDSYENLVVPKRKDSSHSSTHHKYEEIVLNNDMLYAQRNCHRFPPSSSHQPSPNMSRDLSPRKSSSLPPGISPEFYSKVHRHPRRRENPYEFSPQPQKNYNFQTLPLRPMHNISIDCYSMRSTPTPSPPSPPLPPPPPPLSSTLETVPVRLMNGTEHFVNLAPSTSSLHSFGSYAY